MKIYYVYIQHYNDFKDNLWKEKGKYFYNKIDAENEVDLIKEKLLEKYNCYPYKNKDNEFEIRDKNVGVCELCGRTPNDIYRYQTIKFEEIEVLDKIEESERE